MTDVSDRSIATSRFAASLAAEERLHPWLIVAAALSVRTGGFTDPGTAVLGWRSADLASVALSYYEHGLKFFHPEVFWGGPGPNYVEMEFPLVPFVLAVLYRTFGVAEGLAVVVPLLSGLAGPIGLYILCRRLMGAAPALVGAVLFGLSPVFANITRHLFSDGPMTALTVWGVVAFERWTRTKSRWMLGCAALTLALAGLLKPYALVVGAPLLYLSVARFGFAYVLRRPAIWAFAVLTLVPVALWYWHAQRIGTLSGNSFGVLSGGYVKFASADLLSSPRFWTRLAGRLAIYHGMTLGALGCAVGLVLRSQTVGLTMFKVWFAAAMAGALVTAEGTYQMDYYQLPILPPAFALAGVGILRASGWLERISAPLNGRLRQALVSCVVLVAAASVLASQAVFHLRVDTEPAQAAQRDQGRRIAGLIQADTPIILVTSEYSGSGPQGSFTWRKLRRGQHMTPPELFYFSRHRGWYLATPWVSLDEVEGLRRRGAGYLVVSRHLVDDAMAFRAERPDLVEQFREQYSLLVDAPELLIFDLRQ